MSCYRAMCTKTRTKGQESIFPAGSGIGSQNRIGQNRMLMLSVISTPTIFIRALMTAELMRLASYQEPLISH